MAGLARCARSPVRTCNLEDDDSGQLRPLAKTADGRAAITLPVMDADGTARTVGIFFDFAGGIASDAQRAVASSVATLP